MFNSNKNLQFIDYQDAYFYQQKRKNRRLKRLKAIVLIILLILLVILVTPLAQSQTVDRENSLTLSEQTTTRDNPLINGPQLVFNHPDENKRLALPVDITANIEVNGLVAYTEIKQVFINPYNQVLAGKYQFPLPEHGAIKHLNVKIDDKEIIGQVMEKKAAKAVYNKAKSQGKKASLVQQKRANLFTNHIANIPAQSTVIVTLTYIMPVSFFNNEQKINLPLAITARYHPKHYQQSPAELNSLSPNDELNTRVLANSQASINISLNAGLPLSSIRSTSHNIRSKAVNKQKSAYTISLASQQVIANKNFNLTWQLAPSQQPQISSFTEQVEGEHFTLLTFFPPLEDNHAVLARDIIFIIDTSGSMQGSSIVQAKASLLQAISLLSPNDSFNIIAFNNSADLLFSQTKMATKRHINQAKTFVTNLQADGGTEMYRPLSQALVMKTDLDQTDQAIRQIVFVTDGAVANEFELMTLLDSSQTDFRLFTVGIGAAPNGYFMKKAAQFGRGSYVFIQNHHEVQKSISTLMAHISRPALTNIQLITETHSNQQAQQHIEVYPKKITDLYLNKPMQVAIKSKQPIANIQLTGNTATKAWYQTVPLNKHQNSKGISTIWARRKIEDLLDSLVIGADKDVVRQQVINASIAHQIISPYTSFIAVEQKTPTTLTAINNKSTTPPLLAKAHDSLMVAMPKTALGWQRQLFIGVLCILLAALSLRIWAK